MWRWLYLLLIAFALGACSQTPRQPSYGQPAPVGPLMFQHPDGVKSGHVYCDGGGCPEFVGALYIYYNQRKVTDPKTNKSVITWSRKFCSATLIDKNKILTNRHCIDGVLLAGALCSKNGVQMQMRFPTDDPTKFEPYGCAKVLSASEMTKFKIAPDWAVIQLNRNVSNRKPVEVSDSQSDSNKFTMYPVFFDRDKKWSEAVGVIRKVTCENDAYNDYNIFSFGETAPLFTLKNCDQKLYKGNSGSGVLTGADNKIMGVMATVDLSQTSTRVTGTRWNCIETQPSAAVNQTSGIKTSGVQNACLYDRSDEAVKAFNRISFIGHYRRYMPMPTEFLDTFIQTEPDFIYDTSQNTPLEKTKFKITLDGFLAEREQRLAVSKPRLRRAYMRQLKGLYFPYKPICVQQNDNKEVYYIPARSFSMTFREHSWVEEEVSASRSKILRDQWSQIRPNFKSGALELQVTERLPDTLKLKMNTNSDFLVNYLSDVELEVPYCP